MSNLLAKIIAYYKNTVKIKSENKTVQTRVEQSYVCKSESQKKIYDLINAIKFNPRDSKNYWNLKFSILSLHWVSEKIDPDLLEQGVSILLQVIENHPDFYFSHVVLGILLTEQNKRQEAIDCFQTASYKQTFLSHPQLVESCWSINQKRPPDFIITGFMKCGTSSLYSYLVKDPHILSAVDKELWFFTPQFFDHGLDFYLAHFPAISEKTNYLTGEATPCYINFTDIAKKVFNFFPNIKLIILLRNPIERAISSYHHEHKYQKLELINDELKLMIPTAIETIKNRIVDNPLDLLFPLEASTSIDGYMYNPCLSLHHLFFGLYVFYLKEWLSVFPRDQFLILKSEDLFSNPPATMKQVYDFLGLPHHQLSFYRNSNVGSYSPISDNLRSQLKEFYRPYNQQLEEYLGMKFNWE
ncbi:sulfotransferase [Geminocystis sp. GBBB08]|uniref:sulfotransferase n=1 Tax=Geminocystis sp. GBBB08 TaxID=2604140 RepID=UPI0027E2E958|nr:sulfotransferase [Geminocystis sp. GBBB08]MBL1208609.1 sulfotransferase domain-containing protein [Geminocystis sp. GBBB08]